MSSSEEDEFELSYIKIDNKNEINILKEEDLVIDTNLFLTTVEEFSKEIIGKNLSNRLREIIPDGTDKFKLNIEYSKKFLKSINSDKKSLYASINRILSTDYKEKFIFNQTNLQDVGKILTIIFGELKKSKISTINDLKNMIEQINFEKYDFYKLYLNEKIKIEKEKIDISSSRQSSQCKSTTLSSIGIPFEETSEIEENNLLIGINRYHNQRKNKYYIDNNIKNVMCSSILTSDYNYNEEELLRKTLTKENFFYPNTNKKIEENNLLPIELILILYKLKNVNTLIFQIKNIDEQFIKMAVFILINTNWLFINGIKEVKFDLGNDQLQFGINEAFRERTEDLYNCYKKNRSLIYNLGSYQARTINLWEPEEDIFLENNDINNENGKKEFFYSFQPIEESSTFDNHLCNIYNIIGNLTKLKYIRPINYTIKIQFNKLKNDDGEDSGSHSNSNKEIINLSASDISRMERESISITYSNNLISKTSGNISNNTQNNNNIQTNTNNNSINLKNTPQVIKKFVLKKREYFDMISVYSYFLSKQFPEIEKLCLYFHSSYSYELSLLNNINLSFDQSHFLIFINQINHLKEVDFSFNSLDEKSFGYILGIINNNNNISSLKMSFFTPDINYYDDSLFSLCSSRKISLTKLFQEQNEFEIKNFQDKKGKINDFILNQKLLQPFAQNLRNFFNLLKTVTINKLKEFILRFDIPIPLIDNDNYNILIIKFIINLLIMISFQFNHVKTFKILAPNLELNCNKKPYIRQLFREISLEDEKLENDLKDKDDIEKNKKDEKNSNKELSNQKRSEINQNASLENIILQFKIYNLPEIFNIFINNNLKGLKMINLGTLDETTFIEFMNSYKKFKDKLINLSILKISLGPSVTSYEKLEKYIIDYININTPKLEEKYLLSNLQIIYEKKMKELVNLVYFTAVTPKLVVEIGSGYVNDHNLSKILYEYISKFSNEMYSLIIIFQKPEFEKLNVRKIFECLSSFYEKKKNRAILCKENPNSTTI